MVDSTARLTDETLRVRVLPGAPFPNRIRRFLDREKPTALQICSIVISFTTGSPGQAVTQQGDTRPDTGNDYAQGPCCRSHDTTAYTCCSRSGGPRNHDWCPRAHSD